MDLARSLDEDQETHNLQIAILSFLNALINYKAGEVRRLYLMSVHVIILTFRRV